MVGWALFFMWSENSPILLYVRIPCKTIRISVGSLGVAFINSTQSLFCSGLSLQLLPHQNEFQENFSLGPMKTWNIWRSWWLGMTWTPLFFCWNCVWTRKRTTVRADSKKAPQKRQKGLKVGQVWSRYHLSKSYHFSGGRLPCSFVKPGMPRSLSPLNFSAPVQGENPRTGFWMHGK